MKRMKLVMKKILNKANELKFPKVSDLTNEKSHLWNVLYDLNEN